jgi:hypothetical protein
MNILELQENLKDYPDRRLMQEMQMPSGNAPQFLVLSELQRRKRMRDEYKRQDAADMPTVAEEVVTAAGVPQQGLTAIARDMAPNTNVAQDTGLAQAMPMQATRAPQPMADGGIVKMETGGFSNMTQYPFFRDNELTATYDLSNIASFIQRGYPREGLVANFGEDAVREAESMLLYKDDIGQIPLGTGDNFSKQRLRLMEQRTKEGFKGEKLPPNFGNKSYRDPSQSTYLGGESIQNVPANIESFIPELENPYEESEDIYSTLALDTAQAPELEDPYAEPENPLRPKTGFGSNPAYTYETFLEENGLNDVPQAQEMFINYINYMNERGPTSDPRVYSPFLDKAPDAPKNNADSGALPSVSPMDEELAANTLFPEGMGTALQEFNKQQNAGFGDISGGSDSMPASILAASSDDAEQRALEKSYEEQRESRSLSNQLKGGLANTAGLIKDFAGDAGTYFMEEVKPDIDFTAKAITETFFGGEDETDASAEFIKTREQVLPDVPKNDNPDDTSPVTDPDPAGFGSTDSRIAKMLAERQKQSESNKWLALAEAGFKMMDSKSPTVLGAIGEGGQAGLKALSASKKGMQAFETDMLKLQTQLDAARIRSQNTGKLAPAALVTAAESAVKRAQTAFDNARTQAERSKANDDLKAAKAYLNEITRRVASQFAATANISTNPPDTRTQV